MFGKPNTDFMNNKVIKNEIDLKTTFPPKIIQMGKKSGKHNQHNKVSTSKVMFCGFWNILDNHRVA